MLYSTLGKSLSVHVLLCVSLWFSATGKSSLVFTFIFFFILGLYYSQQPVLQSSFIVIPAAAAYILFNLNIYLYFNIETNLFEF